MRRLFRWLTASLVLALAGAWCAARAETFPPITDGERGLASVAGSPNAPAVVLFQKADLQLEGYAERVDFNAGASHLVVQVRTKILTDEGAKSWGEIAIQHSDYSRLQGFEGRTVLPDGRTVPVAKNAKFQRKVSQTRRVFVTSVAFPAVQKGAILDYRYELIFASAVYLEPWYFSAEVPVLRSEITYKIPQWLGMKQWSRDPFRAGLHRESKESTRGVELHVWAENLPAVQIDPYGLPFGDLVAQTMLLPAFIHEGTMHTKIADSWQTVSENAEEFYDPMRRKDRGVEKTAREIAGKVQGGPRDKAQALYRFVRDGITTDDASAARMLFGENASVEKTLADKHGYAAEKALLLQAFLAKAGLDGRLVWAADRRHGQIDPALPSPAWFDRLLVAVDLDGKRVYLDPADRQLGFGQLSPWYEGTPAFIPDKKKPEGVVLPETPFDQSARKAVVDLGLDASGRLAGTGELVLTGNPAWERMHWKEDDAKTAEAWKAWLAERFKELKVDGVKVEESPDERKVRVTWSLQQREDEVLGDEATLVPSRPLGPESQPFVQTGDKRRSAVLFPYAGREEVELRLHWPAGWKVDVTPKLAKQESALGGLTVNVDGDDAGRSLVYRRRFDVKQKLLTSPQQYEAVRSLYAAVEKSDAQTLSLVRH